MLCQVALVVLATLATCHSYPVTRNPYQLSAPHPPLQLLLPYPGPLATKQVLPTDVGSSANIKTYMQAGLTRPTGGQFLFYYPGGPGSAPVIYAVKNNGKDEEEGGGGGSYNPFGSLYNFFAGYFESTTAKPAEEESPEKEPEKVSESQGTTKPTAANLETFDEDGPTQPTSSRPVDPKQPEQKLFLIGQPQFFGNYDALKNPEIIKELGNKNPFPNVLLTNNQQPFFWQTKYSPVSYGSPGKAATEFQKILAASNQKQVNEDEKEKYSPEASSSFSRKKPVLDKDSIVVEALKIQPHAASEEESEETEVSDAERGEPSVAQVRPQAIALAGPSGVAAAAPVGTAVVGRGGLAVAAPSATAVAGPSGGAPPVIAPATRTAHQAYVAAHNQARFLERAAPDEGEDYYS